MKLDPSKLRALANMDDRRFAELVFTAAKAVGLSPAEAKTAANNAHAFKAVLRNASDEELALLVNKLSKNPADLMKQLGGGGGL